jgi:hypothetical protein
MQLFIALFKWIFTLNELVWFISGGLFFTSTTYLYLKLREMNKFSKLSFTLIISSALTFSFTLLWAASSYEENEIIAANLGLVIFGGLASILGIIAYRLILKEGKLVRNDK